LFELVQSGYDIKFKKMYHELYIEIEHQGLKAGGYVGFDKADAQRVESEIEKIIHIIDKFRGQ
jgi:hypothetical protein